MKKKKVNGLGLNKKSISNLKQGQVSGGTGQSVNQTCTGWATCGNCTVDCGTGGPWESVQFCWFTWQQTCGIK